MKKKNKEQSKKNSINFFWPRLETREESERVIHESFWFFLFVAILIGVLYTIVFVDYLGIVEALFLLFLALMVRFTKSRFFSVVLFILISLEVAFTILARLGITEGGTNIFLAALFFLVGLNTLRATFKYKFYKKT